MLLRIIILLKKVMLPSTLIKIGKQSFYGCERMFEVINLENVKDIGEEAFRGSGLIKVEINEGITKLGKGCFSYMPYLKEVNLNIESNIKFNDTFIRCKNLEKIIFKNINIFHPSFVSGKVSLDNKNNLSTFFDAFMGTPFFHSLHDQFLSEIKNGNCPICHNSLKKTFFKRECLNCNINFVRVK